MSMARWTKFNIHKCVCIHQCTLISIKCVIFLTQYYRAYFKHRITELLFKYFENFKSCQYRKIIIDAFVFPSESVKKWLMVLICESFFMMCLSKQGANLGQSILRLPTLLFRMSSFYIVTFLCDEGQLVHLSFLLEIFI